MRTGALDPESNMNFGEGGAGAYTDGKLGTRIHHPAVRKVVELFARFGGRGPDPRPRGSRTSARTFLPGAISAMREELERGGCTFHWGTRVVDVDLAGGRVRGALLADGRTLPCDRLVLAPGNSARELFELFARRGWPIEAKPFAAGFRAEHPQPLIDRIQYGPEQRHPRLPPADYRLADNPVGGAAGVFSFCMCPGGVVVPTPTEPGMQCTNGMSNSHRSSPLANAGLVVAVSPADFARGGLRRAAGRPRVAAQVGAGRLRAGRRRLPAPPPSGSPTTWPAAPARRPAAPPYRPA